MQTNTTHNLTCTNCTAANNGTESPNNPGQISCTASCITSFVLYVIIIVVALFGNILVVYAFAVNKKIRQSLATYFIVSLAVSDMFTASVVMPFDLDQLLTSYLSWKHGSLMCSIWTTLYLLMVPTSILNLLALTVDRYKTLSDPLNRFKESPFMTKNKALIIIAMVWIYSLLFALIPEMGWKMYPTVIVHGVCMFNISPEYSMLSSVINFFIPLVTMCVLYLQIYRIAMRTSTTPVAKVTSPVTSPYIQPKNARNRKKASNIKKEKMLQRNTRAAKTVLVIVCTFVFCWMPYTIFSFVNTACRSCFNVDGIAIVHIIFLIMGYANSALNPFLFGLTHPLFKKTFKTLFKRFLSKCGHERPLNTMPVSVYSTERLPYVITHSGSVHMINANEDIGTRNLGASLNSLDYIN